MTRDTAGWQGSMATLLRLVGLNSCKAPFGLLLCDFSSRASAVCSGAGSRKGTASAEEQILLPRN